MSGCILNVQAKARTAFQSEDAESFTFQADADDLDYWLNGNVPTILVVCRPDSGDAYWISIRDYFADSAKRNSRKVRFNKIANRFDGNAAPTLVALARSKDFPGELRFSKGRRNTNTVGYPETFRPSRQAY